MSKRDIPFDMLSHSTKMASFCITPPDAEPGMTIVHAADARAKTLHNYPRYVNCFTHLTSDGVNLANVKYLLKWLPYHASELFRHSITATRPGLVPQIIFEDDRDYPANNILYKLPIGRTIARALGFVEPLVLGDACQFLMPFNRLAIGTGLCQYQRTDPDAPAITVVSPSANFMPVTFDPVTLCYHINVYMPGKQHSKRPLSIPLFCREKMVVSPDHAFGVPEGAIVVTDGVVKVTVAAQENDAKLTVSLPYFNVLEGTHRSLTHFNTYTRVYTRLVRAFIPDNSVSAQLNEIQKILNVAYDTEVEFYIKRSREIACCHAIASNLSDAPNSSFSKMVCEYLGKDSTFLIDLLTAVAHLYARQLIELRSHLEREFEVIRNYGAIHIYRNTAGTWSDANRVNIIKSEIKKMFTSSVSITHGSIQYGPKGSPLVIPTIRVTVDRITDKVTQAGCIDVTQDEARWLQQRTLPARRELTDGYVLTRPVPIDSTTIGMSVMGLQSVVLILNRNTLLGAANYYVGERREFYKAKVRPTLIALTNIRCGILRDKSIEPRNTPEDVNIPKEVYLEAFKGELQTGFANQVKRFNRTVEAMRIVDSGYSGTVKIPFSIEDKKTGDIVVAAPPQVLAARTAKEISRVTAPITTKLIKSGGKPAPRSAPGGLPSVAIAEMEEVKKALFIHTQMMDTIRKTTRIQ